MLPQCVQTGIRNPHLRYTVSWLVAAVLTLQPVIAADVWSRVTRCTIGTPERLGEIGCQVASGSARHDGVTTSDKGY